MTLTFIKAVICGIGLVVGIMIGLSVSTCIVNILEDIDWSKLGRWK